MRYFCWSSNHLQELTSKKEKDFLTVLSMIKKKDPKIYAKDVKFFHDDDGKSLRRNSTCDIKNMLCCHYQIGQLHYFWGACGLFVARVASFAPEQCSVSQN